MNRVMITLLYFSIITASVLIYKNIRTEGQSVQSVESTIEVVVPLLISTEHSQPYNYSPNMGPEFLVYPYENDPLSAN